MRNGGIAFTVDPSDEELARDWTLSAEDLAEVRRCRGDDMQHSFALQLCVLRLCGRFLGRDYSTVPVRVLNHLGRQLGLPPVLILAPPARKMTDLDHERRLRDYLGFSTFDGEMRLVLEKWLTEQAAQGLLADELLDGAERFLRQERVVRPARSTLERMIGAISARSEEARFAAITDRLSRKQCEAIDELLETNNHRSILLQLKQYPPEPRPDAINAYLDRAETLHSVGAGEIDLSGFRREVVIHFADLVRRYDADRLKRLVPPKRYAMVACFLAEANKSVLDHLVEMHHVFLTGLERRAKRAFENHYRALRQQSRRNLRVVLDALEAVLDSNKAPELDRVAVGVALEGCREFQRFGEHGKLDELRARHHMLKRYLPRFLRLPFEGQPGTEQLLIALENARLLHAEDSKRSNKGAMLPIDFAKGFWRSALTRSPDVRTWELALAFAVREALRSGDLFLPESRHHVSFWNLIQGADEWAEQRERAYVDLDLPPGADQAIDKLRKEFDAAAGTFVDGLGDNTFAAIDDNKLKLSRRKALDVPESVRTLRRVVETHMPRVRIEDLLVDVDRWCGFTRELMPISGYSARLERPYVTLLAALVAHGTNLGIATMAQSAKGLTVDMLQYATRWFLRPLLRLLRESDQRIHTHRRPVLGLRLASDFLRTARGNLRARRPARKRHRSSTAGALHRYGWGYRAALRAVLPARLLFHAAAQRPQRQAALQARAWPLVRLPRSASSRCRPHPHPRAVGWPSTRCCLAEKSDGACSCGSRSTGGELASRSLGEGPRHARPSGHVHPQSTLPAQPQHTESGAAPAQSRRESPWSWTTRLLRKPGRLPKRRLCRDHEQGQRPQRVVECGARLEQRSHRGDSR